MPSLAETTSIALFVGVYISAIFYGVTSLQTVSYFRSERARRDSLLLKAMVSILWVLDTIESIFSAMGLYYIDFLHFEDILSTATIYWPFLASTIIEGVIDTIVPSIAQGSGLEQQDVNHARDYINAWNCLYAYLSKTSAGLVSNFLDTSVISIWLPATAVNLTPTGIQSYQALTYAFVILSVISDTLISGILVSLLWIYRKHTAYQRTASILGNLILYTISTGALTSIIAVAILITYVSSKSLAYGGIRMLVTKVYINAVLATLNQRSAPSTDSQAETLAMPPRSIRRSTIVFASETMGPQQNTDVRRDQSVVSLTSLEEGNSLAALSTAQKGAGQLLSAKYVESIQIRTTPN
ncbi:hypothetical protein GYMLUDRAFT_243790 [Collybiopsis luxurians FD-317 M1]|uniref:Unplaced genomic scaffold GYMLUscaffold_24, whole genome shotgun sequence n=1 Tax=Collybiopsis luxurians FD-317 M1 TaxID=944289 RepID=A0A0D0CQ41_9AGAR|nr:hypothetical protein GYMLUDRAFT_243790 [Collybiopsis luxurians FD-317 M1]